MTTQTEALKLAHEELKHIKDWCLRRTGIGLVDENVLAKVEEALANHIEDNLTMVAQPEQEPVAWIVGDDLTIRADWVEGLNWKGSWVDVGRAIPKQWTPVLYTTPPQRKPLTHEAIATVYWGATGQSLRPQDNVLAHKFARAIEAAHGIKA